MNSSFRDVFNRIDRLIKNAEGLSARELVLQIASKAPPRNGISELAQFAWRVGIPEVGIRLLSPVVRGTGRKFVRASDGEKIEYAACLIKAGASEEGLELLQSLEPGCHPRVALYKAFAYISRWDYSKSIPLLEQYLSLQKDDEYQTVVGLVNLAGAQIYEGRFEEASKTLQETIRKSKAQNFNLLLGNSLELSAANAIYQREFSTAEDALKKARELLKKMPNLDAFIVEKWSAILEFAKQSTHKVAQGKLSALRREATRRLHWETVRECDRFRALYLKDVSLLIRLWFGTPYESYRRKILSEFAESIELPQIYEWTVHAGSPLPKYKIFEGEKIKGKALPAGQIPYRLLARLCSDFYRPQRLATLHFNLFPKQFFNPVTAPHRVHEAVRRLRNWFAEAQLPFRVEEKDSSYWLSSLEPAVLLIPRTGLSREGWRLKIKRLNEKFSNQPFSLPEAMKALEASPSTTLRLLKTAKENGLLTTTGQSRSTRYQFISEK